MEMLKIPKLINEIDKIIKLIFIFFLFLSISIYAQKYYGVVETRAITLETTHIENIFLEGQQIFLITKAFTHKYSALNLNYKIKQKVNGNGFDLVRKGSDIISLERDSNRTIDVGALPIGKYTVYYSFSKGAEVVSKNNFEITVIREDYLSREKQLELLRTKRILVPMWGWPYKEMCNAAKKFGYNVFMPPRFTQDEIAYYLKHGLECIIRPAINVEDPFDSEEVKAGCRQLKKTIEFYSSDPKVLGFSIMWGLYGEGGFKVPPYGKYEFSEKAKKAFNNFMDTPNEPLPVVDTSGQPSNMRYIKWIEFRQKTLNNFRKDYISEAKKVTNKIVGTWSEVYPVSHYTLNMGIAPNADFMCYDLSFGDVTFNQRIGFAETHGDMQHYPNFRLWKQHILPLVAKAYGEGVVPMGFQFPMRKGHAANFLSPTKYFTNKIVDEYALKICPYIKKLMSNKITYHSPEVAFVYQSYGASAFPQDTASFYLYENNSREIEAFLHMMGVYMEALPLEKLSSIDLNKYKLLIIPDAMYLTEKMYENIKNTSAKILVTGDFLRAYWDGKKYVEATKWGESKRFDDFEIKYGKLLSGSININVCDSLTRNLEHYENMTYGIDRCAVYKKLPIDAKVLISCNNVPLLIQFDKNRLLHITNRIFGIARLDSNNVLESFAFQLLKNILKFSGVTININNPPMCRTMNYVYAPYGLSNNILWNQTDKNLKLSLLNDYDVNVLSHGWKNVKKKL
ncbi:MAG: hypothetical protein ACYC49_13545 [Ignavibacteriaceae bacterium]